MKLLKKIITPKIRLGVLALGCWLTWGCNPTRTTSPTPQRPSPTRPSTPKPNQPSTPSTPAPPGGTKPSTPSGGQPGPLRQTYRVAVVLPFLSNQFDGSVPEKSRFATQFYGGMQVALTGISTDARMPDLVVDVFDAQATDAEFQVLLAEPRLAQAQVVIGPPKSSQVALLAEKTKARRQILLSPDSPISDLTTQNPGFIQTKPALRAHCTKIVQHLRNRQKYAPSQIILVAKEKERDRLAYFQDPNKALGGAALTEVIVPDASTNFDKIDLKKHLKPGQTTAFVLPTWAGQDWVLAFLSRLKMTKGNHRVEVYGMPQWLAYEQLEPELLTDLNVHITSSSYLDRQSDDVRDFERAFYDLHGTLPDDDAFNGYDTARFVAEMLRDHGLSFPEKLTSSNKFVSTLRGAFFFRKTTATGTLDGAAQADYVENIFVHLLRFDRFGYVPAE
jgi:hypothetical protein